MTVLAIEGAKVFAGPRLAPIPKGVVLIDGDRIVAVGPRSEVQVPAACKRIAASGTSLLPGFIDAHVHIGFYDPSRVLLGGVTTVRDLAWPPADIWPLVERSRDVSFGGPTILAVGQMLTVKRGYPLRAAWAPKGTGRAVSSEADARSAVDEQVRAGAVAIKVALNPLVGPTLDLPVLRAIVDAAHEQGRRVTGHVYGLDELHKALDAAMDELAHTLMSPERIPDETIARMVEQGMTVVPTLSCTAGRQREISIDNVGRFWDAGGTIVYGTDLGNEGPVPGIDPNEVRAMSEAGMSPADIVASATTVAARLLGVRDAGSIEAGKAADVIAVAGDAETDASVLAEVEMVFRGGRRAK